jgi:hypothetical protein
MLVRPMIDSWEPPRIERIRSFEARRLATLPVVGLSGDLHQDLGRGALAVEIVGSLSTDEARDQFLKDVREKFLAGEPVDFVADIVKESELERVLIAALHLQEAADEPSWFRYRVVLVEYTEPPEPPAPATDLGLDLDADLGLDALAGLDLLDLPALAADIPKVGDLLAPLKPAAENLKKELANAGTVLAPLDRLLGGGA